MDTHTHTLIQNNTVSFRKSKIKVGLNNFCKGHLGAKENIFSQQWTHIFIAFYTIKRCWKSTKMLFQCFFIKKEKSIMENFIISVVPRCGISLNQNIVNISRIVKIKHHHWILSDSTSAIYDLRIHVFY